MVAVVIALILLFLFLIYYYVYDKQVVYTYESLKYYNKVKWINLVEHLKEETSGAVVNKRDDPRVIFLFSYSYENNKLPEYFLFTKKIVQAYCDENGYELMEINHKENNMSPYWIRVYDMIKISKTLNNGDIIVYLDMDTSINPIYKSLKITHLLDCIDKVVGKEFDIYVGSDPIGSNVNYNMVFNTGVMIFRISDWSKDFLIRWMKRYKHSLWNYESGKWDCRDSFNMKCPWAKLDGAYEQASFNVIYYLNKHNEINKICKLHYSVLSNWIKHTDAFIYHIMGSTNKDRLTFFKNLYRKLTD
jgi:hypothetical protein